MRNNPSHQNYPGCEKKLLTSNYSSFLMRAYLERKIIHSKQKKHKQTTISSSSG
jgi:hypothetical protein